MKFLTCAAVATLLLTACSSASTDAGTASAGSTPHPSTRSTVATSTSAVTSPTATAAAGVISTDRCGEAAKGARPFTLHAGDAKLPAAHLGSGPDAAVLLHQTDGDGACGWLPAARLMAERGIHVIVFDLCGYGSARCDDVKPPTPAAQVIAAVTWARHHGAGRVTVVGASMGGSIALGTANTVAPQGVVDLSGPMSWDGVQSSAVAARSLRVPLLAAASADDPNSDAAALAKAVASSPARQHRFVRTKDGHGIELLTSYHDGKDTPTALLGTVVRWIKGDYA